MECWLLQNKHQRALSATSKVVTGYGTSMNVSLSLAGRVVAKLISARSAGTMLYAATAKGCSLRYVGNAKPTATIQIKPGKRVRGIRKRSCGLMRWKTLSLARRFEQEISGGAWARPGVVRVF